MPVTLKKTQARTAKRIGISGKAGSGKTTAIFKLAKNPLIIDLENKIPLECAGKGDQVDFKGRESFKYVKQELINVLNDPKLPWDLLVIDTASKLEEHCENNAIEMDYKGDRNKYSAYSSGPKNELPQYFSEILDLLSRIQERHNIDILIVCHATAKLQNNVTGKDYYKMVLDLKDAVNSRMLKWFDYLGFVWDDVTIDETSFHAKAGAVNRVISFDNSNPLFDAKSLRPTPAKIPFDREGKWVETVFGKAA